MTSIHHVKHLALLKRRGRVLRASKGEEQAAFFLVCNRDTGEALLHIGSADDDPGSYRNPAHI